MSRSPSVSSTTVLAGKKVKADSIAKTSLVAPILDIHSRETRFPIKDSAI